MAGSRGCPKVYQTTIGKVALGGTSAVDHPRNGFHLTFMASSVSCLPFSRFLCLPSGFLHQLLKNKVAGSSVQRNFHLRSITTTGSQGAKELPHLLLSVGPRHKTIKSNKNHTSHPGFLLQLGLPYHGLSYQYLPTLTNPLYQIYQGNIGRAPSARPLVGVPPTSPRPLALFPWLLVS